MARRPQGHWLLLGTGRDRIAELQPAHVGAGSTERFSIEEGLALQPSNRRFEFGTDSHALHAGLTPALDWFDQLGWDWIEARIAHLSTYLKEGLSRIPGVTLLTPMAFEQSSGLTSFELEGADEKALMRHLKDDCRVFPRAVGPHRIRVSTAFYNTEEEIDRLVSGVRSFAV